MKKMKKLLLTKTKITMMTAAESTKSTTTVQKKMMTKCNDVTTESMIRCNCYNRGPFHSVQVFAQVYNVSSNTTSRTEILFIHRNAQNVCRRSDDDSCFFMYR